MHALSNWCFYGGMLCLLYAGAGFVLRSGVFDLLVFGYQRFGALLADRSGEALRPTYAEFRAQHRAGWDARIPFAAAALLLTLSLALAFI